MRYWISLTPNRAARVSKRFFRSRGREARSLTNVLHQRVEVLFALDTDGLQTCLVLPAGARILSRTGAATPTARARRDSRTSSTASGSSAREAGKPAPSRSRLCSEPNGPTTDNAATFDASSPNKVDSTMCQSPNKRNKPTTLSTPGTASCRSSFKPCRGEVTCSAARCRLA